MFVWYLVVVLGLFTGRCFFVVLVLVPFWCLCCFSYSLLSRIILQYVCSSRTDGHLVIEQRQYFSWRSIFLQTFVGVRRLLCLLSWSSEPPAVLHVCYRRCIRSTQSAAVGQPSTGRAALPRMSCMIPHVQRAFPRNKHPEENLEETNVLASNTKWKTVGGKRGVLLAGGRNDSLQLIVSRCSSAHSSSAKQTVEFIHETESWLR